MSFPVVIRGKNAAEIGKITKMRQNYKTKTLAIGLCFAGYQKSFGFLLGWLHSESFPPKAYVPQTKFPQKKLFLVFLALFGPFQALFKEKKSIFSPCR